MVKYPSECEMGQVFRNIRNSRTKVVATFLNEIKYEAELV
jgi:hypothetical protein